MGYTHVGENVGDEKSLGDNKTTWREKSAVGEKHTLETCKRDWKHTETKNAIDIT